MAGETPERRILLFGAGGQLGHELQRTLTGLGTVTALDQADADFSAPESLRPLVRQHRPHVIVNAAAYTAVDKAEEEPDLAALVNGIAPGVLAEEAERLGACIVHYSTDYVFDGRKSTPYVEGDEPNPLSAYGRGKLAGERAVARACPRHLILRTSWVFAAHGANFVKTMLRLAAERDALRVVNDQYGTPTSAALLADTTTRLLGALLPTRHDHRWGLYHLTASGDTSWYYFAHYIITRAHLLGMQLKTSPDHVVAITTADYPTPATRPTNSRLDTMKLRRTFPGEVPALPDWRQGVDHVMDQLRSEFSQ